MSNRKTKPAAARWSEYLPLGSIKGAERNPKKHTPDLGGSIGRFGYADGVILDERTGRLVAGHGRTEQLLAMKAAGEAPPDGIEVLGDEWLIPVQRGWSSRSDSEAEAFLVAHNQLGTAGGWDEDELAKLLADLEDRTGLGFDEAELDDLLGSLKEPEEETSEPVEPPADPVSKAGELYQLGPHRLICGDSTDAETVARLLDGAKPRLMVTDPPYGCEYDASWRVDAGLTSGGRMGKVRNDDRSDWREAWKLFPGAVAYVWHNWLTTGAINDHLAESGFEARAMIVWGKERLAISRGHYHGQHEVAWYVVKKGETADWIGDRKQTTLWTIGLDKNLEGDVKHSTQKPLECMERPIRHHEGDVYEPFAGSGTTLIAAQKQSRKCYAIELDPAYCDVIRKRWGDYARANNLDAGPDAL